jgi:hypothetical protein
MSPTVFNEGPYRFFFYSREENRLHVHVSSSQGEAKFWLEPIISLRVNYGFSKQELTKIQKIIEVRQYEIKRNWKKHFKNS